MEERTGEAFELGERLTVVGKKLQRGAQAPDFILDHLDATDSAIHQVRLADSAGMVRLLNVVNSLDTPVCDVETRHWETLRADLPSNVHIYTISMDLPFAQARWQASEGVKHQALSAHRSEQFGQDSSRSQRALKSPTASLYAATPLSSLQLGARGICETLLRNTGRVSRGDLRHMTYQTTPSLVS